MEKHYTLARGGRARQFGFVEEDGGITFFTGKDFGSEVYFTNEEIESITSHFQGKGWFPLSNDQTGKNLKENGLGAFLKTELDKSPKNASHVAAYLVLKEKLDYRDDSNFLEFKVK